jgi:hypothetical protein
MTGEESIGGWLLVVSSGRYRLLSEDQVQADPQLGSIHSLVTQGKTAAAMEPTEVQEVGRAALVARLLPTTITPPPPGWRVTIPKLLKVLTPPECDLKQFVVLLSPEGYCEIWCTETLRRAAFLPWPF